MEYPEVLTIHQIAARHKIPVKYLEQILLELRRGGVVASRRGVHGGYLLAKPPSEISVGEVLQVVDNRFVDSSCDQQDSDRGFVCSGSDTCGLQQVWRDVRSAAAKILFETSFEEVCARSNGKRPPVDATDTLARLVL
jgi:Rrf2 family protein